MSAGRVDLRNVRGDLKGLALFTAATAALRGPREADTPAALELRAALAPNLPACYNPPSCSWRVRP